MSWGEREMSHATRVAIVDDHAILAEALRVALTLKGLNVVCVAVPSQNGNPNSQLTSVLRARPRVVLLDLDLGPAGDGTKLIRPLSRAGHHVVVLTASEDEARWGAALGRGALTVLSKSAPLQLIVDVIDRITQGLPVTSRAERERLIQLWQEHHTDDDERHRRLERLTPREAFVLGELVRGKRVREVAVESFVSEATVRTQVKSILAKLGVTSQLAAVALARDVDWVPPHVSPGQSAGGTSTLPPASDRARYGAAGHLNR
jgi:two-component system, NarL family, nitrate/nitrite response regulator NarL